ncbi:hypothetical protein GFL80_30745 [Rhizobium leguminosarum bv. viciae]|nr:hypothetical protein [Rhizobium leguminosarum bv. viciae]NKK88534.1 hypothetical protein [Rhizobium leguminosarum bv. viciae]
MQSDNGLRQYSSCALLCRASFQTRKGRCSTLKLRIMLSEKRIRFSESMMRWEIADDSRHAPDDYPVYSLQSGDAGPDGRWRHSGTAA